MSETIEFEAKARAQHGTNASRRLRHNDEVPAVIYGGGEAPQSLTLEHHRLLKALEKEAFVSSILTINIDGKKVQAVLKSLQRHPFKPKVLHADFLRVSAKEKIAMRVPLHFEGGDKAPGVKLGGGIVSHVMNEIDIKCLPKDLPEFIAVDLSELEVDSAIHLSGITLPEGVEFASAVEKGSDHDLPVVAIHVPRGSAADDDSAGEEGKTEAKSDDKDS